MKQNKLLQIFGAIIICQLAGIIGSFFTTPNIATWYAYLVKPVFSPPNWLFGPAWLTFYTLMGISLFLVWQKILKDKKAKSAVILFLIHLFFNAIWSILFFGLHSPLLGLIDIILLLVLIIIIIIKFYKINNIAAYLLIPYLLWVSFATVLNLSIYLLN